MNRYAEGYIAGMRLAARIAARTSKWRRAHTDQQAHRERLSECLIIVDAIRIAAKKMRRILRRKD